MRIGIDFGTTRVVVAAADRGNFPVVTFDGPDGEGVEWCPSLLVALPSGELRAGHEAAAALRAPGAQPLRSLKRLLTNAGPLDTALGLPVAELAARFLSSVRLALLHRSNLGARPGEPLEAAIAVPANAPANQRMLTADAFRRAGFDVVRILDEPSAAGLEYAFRRPVDAQVKKRHIAVYDLGGGTFDASVIAMSDARHEVLTTEGVGRLGGDDFDEVMLSLACRAARRPEPTGGERDRLLELCRLEKERINASTRRLAPELFEGAPVRIPVDEYEAALRPIVDRSIAALDCALARLSDRAGAEIERHTVVYQVGGGSQLPAVGRALRERFGRRVWRSPYPHASVAIGLAVAAGDEAGTRITGALSRHFGVWRERDAGRAVVFDPIFEKDTPLASEPLVAVRRYRAQHNVGHYRFLECSRLQSGAPAGDVTPWGEVRAPLTSDVAGRPLDGVEVMRLSHAGDEVEERYSCDPNGIIEVEIRNLHSGAAVRFTPQSAGGGAGSPTP